QLVDWLKIIRSQQIKLREFEHTALLEIKQWSEIPPGTSLFNSVLVFEDYQIDKRLRALGDNWEKRDFTLLEQTNYQITVAAYADSDLLLRIEYDRERFDEATVKRMLQQVRTILEDMADNLRQTVGQLQFLPVAEQRRLLVDWNRTKP